MEKKIMAIALISVGLVGSLLADYGSSRPLTDDGVMYQRRSGQPTLGDRIRAHHAKHHAKHHLLSDSEPAYYYDYRPHVVRTTVGAAETTAVDAGAVAETATEGAVDTAEDVVGAVLP